VRPPQLTIITPSLLSRRRSTVAWKTRGGSQIFLSSFFLYQPLRGSWPLDWNPKFWHPPPLKRARVKARVSSPSTLSVNFKSGGTGQWHQPCKATTKVSLGLLKDFQGQSVCSSEFQQDPREAEGKHRHRLPPALEDHQLGVVSKLNTRGQSPCRPEGGKDEASVLLLQELPVAIGEKHSWDGLVSQGRMPFQAGQTGWTMPTNCSLGQGS